VALLRQRGFLLLWTGQFLVARRATVSPSGIYLIGHSALYHKALHDVTAGNNTVRFPPRTISGYQAKPGWDAVTGWGSPDASVLVPLLSRYVHPDDVKGL
jgi:hypothetical protein